MDEREQEPKPRDWAGLVGLLLMLFSGGCTVYWVQFVLYNFGFDLQTFMFVFGLSTPVFFIGAYLLWRGHA